MMNLFKISLHLFSCISQQQKQQIKVRNMSKIDKKHQNDVNDVFWCFIVTFEHISHLFLVFLLLTLNTQMLPRQKHVTILERHIKRLKYTSFTNYPVENLKNINLFSKRVTYIAYTTRMFFPDSGWILLDDYYKYKVCSCLCHVTISP